jgi:hypothetical protein
MKRRSSLHLVRKVRFAPLRSKCKNPDYRRGLRARNRNRNLLILNKEYLLCAICVGDYPAFVAKFLLDKARDKANATGMQKAIPTRNCSKYWIGNDACVKSGVGIDTFPCTLAAC